MCCTLLAEIQDAKYAKIGHLRTIPQLCRAIFATMHVSTIGKKLVKQQYLLHMPSQYGEIGPLTAETGWRFWGTPANFNGVRVLASLLQRRRSTEVNQTLHDVWPSAVQLVYYIYIFGGSCPLSEFCQVQNSLLRPSLAFSCFSSITARHWNSGRQPNFCGMVQVIEPQNFRSSSFSTEGATYIPRAAITLGIGLHSSVKCVLFAAMASTHVNEYYN